MSSNLEQWLSRFLGRFSRFSITFTIITLSDLFLFLALIQDCRWLVQQEKQSKNGTTSRKEDEDSDDDDDSSSDDDSSQPLSYRTPLLTQVK